MGDTSVTPRNLYSHSFTTTPPVIRAQSDLNELLAYVGLILGLVVDVKTREYVALVCVQDKGAATIWTHVNYAAVARKGNLSAHGVIMARQQH